MFGLGCHCWDCFVFIHGMSHSTCILHIVPMLNRGTSQEQIQCVHSVNKVRLISLSLFPLHFSDGTRGHVICVFVGWHHDPPFYPSNPSSLLFPYMLLRALIIPVVFVQVSLLHTYKSRRIQHSTYIIGYKWKRGKTIVYARV